MKTNAMNNSPSPEWLHYHIMLPDGTIKHTIRVPDRQTAFRLVCLWESMRPIVGAARYRNSRWTKKRVSTREAIRHSESADKFEMSWDAYQTTCNAAGVYTGDDQDAMKAEYWDGEVMAECRRLLRLPRRRKMYRFGSKRLS